VRSDEDIELWLCLHLLLVNLSEVIMESEPSNDGARDESPLSDITEVTLWFKFSVDGDWIPTLAIPIEDFSNYTLQPLKWLRFLGFVIYGRQGVLLTDRAGPPVNEDMVSAESLPGSYYYSSPGEQISPTLETYSSIMVDPPQLVNVEALNDRQSDTMSFASSSRAEFVREVVQRDETCVLTSARRRICDAAHLIPHSKGDAVRSFFFLILTLSKGIHLVHSAFHRIQI
jgi:hypothetical protein